MNLPGANPSSQNIYDSLADFMLLALVVAFTRQFYNPPKPAVPFLPATIPSHPGDEPMGIEGPSSISRKEGVPLPQQLRRQRDRYILRWTEAMFEPEE